MSFFCFNIFGVDNSEENVSSSIFRFRTLGVVDCVENVSSLSGTVCVVNCASSFSVSFTGNSVSVKLLDLKQKDVDGVGNAEVVFL